MRQSPGSNVRRLCRRARANSAGLCPDLSLLRLEVSHAVGTGASRHGYLRGDAASMVAAIPTVFARGLDRWTAWQICDIATAPRLRRRGLMRRGLAALLTNLPTGDGIFCLPNRNSHSLLLQARFQEIGRLSLYVSGAALFTRPHDTATDMTVEPMPICADATAFRAAPESMNVTWRFSNDPGVSYARIKVDGAEAVVRPLDAGGPRKLVIMRLCAAKPEAEQRVLRAVMGHAAACRARFVIYLDSGLAGVSCATLHTCSAPTAAAPHADRGSGASRLSRALRCSRLGRSLRPIPTTVRFGSRARSRKKSPKHLDTARGKPPRQSRFWRPASRTRV